MTLEIRAKQGHRKTNEVHVFVFVTVTKDQRAVQVVCPNVKPTPSKVHQGQTEIKLGLLKLANSYKCCC